MPRRFILRFLILLLAGVLLPACAATPSAAPSPVQIERAGKIALALTLSDAAKTSRVRDLIARQYSDLGQIHAVRDAALKTAKALTDHAESEAATKLARTEAEAAQDKLHATYLAGLAAELSPAQIDQVKDGMTYGVLPLTFRVYQEMLPNLTAEQKAQILAWLTEAREHAMDGSTSEEKHAWFGKYKGRINNYLSKAGIDMKLAEKQMSQHKTSGSK